MPFLHLRKKCRPESANANWLRNLSDNEFSLILPKILSCIYRRKMCDKGIQQMSSLPSLSSYIPITTIERRKRKDPSACFVKDVWQSIGYRQLCTAWFDESVLYYNSYLQILSEMLYKKEWLFSSFTLVHKKKYWWDIFSSAFN